MPKPLILSQVLASFTHFQKRFRDALSAAHKQTSSAGDQLGHLKRFTPREEGGEMLADTFQPVRARAIDLIADVAEHAREFVNVASNRDFTNTAAVADVEIDGKVIFAAVPVPHLLFLEAQLTDLYTWVEKMTVRDAAVQWTWNSDLSVWESPKTVTEKRVGKKVPLVLYGATEQHPAQVQVIDEAVLVGTWTGVSYSGAIPEAAKANLLKRIGALLVAVRKAREAANTTPAVTPLIGDKLVAHLFGDLRTITK